MSIALLILGLAVLTGGGELLVRGATALARRVGISSLVVGLTVVAFGTSSPELAVSVKAAMTGRADIALGNVVGSNCFNVLFILGIAALIVPLAASRQLVRFDVPIMIGVSLIAWALAADGSISRADGAGMALGLVVYTAALIRLGRKPSVAGTDPPAGDGPPPRSGRYALPVSLAMLLVGLSALVLGARWFVDGATDLAQALGVSDLLIGLTIVAAGTSMPEVATSIVASVRGQRDIAIGNVVGSNIFNLLGVLGGAAALTPDGIAVPPAALNFDLPVMVAVAFACLPIFLTGGRISRAEGSLFLAYYLAYVLFLTLSATKHEALGPFSATMLWFALPMTALGLVASTVAHLRTARGRRTP